MLLGVYKFFTEPVLPGMKEIFFLFTNIIFTFRN